MTSKKLQLHIDRIYAIMRSIDTTDAQKQAKSIINIVKADKKAALILSEGFSIEKTTEKIIKLAKSNIPEDRLLIVSYGVQFSDVGTYKEKVVKLFQEKFKDVVDKNAEILSTSKISKHDIGTQEMYIAEALNLPQENVYQLPHNLPDITDKKS